MGLVAVFRFGFDDARYARKIGEKIKNINKTADTDFFQRVYAVVRQIPVGKVTTYGAIGKAIGLKSSARMVGWALNAAATLPGIPFHRVVNRNGELTGKRYFSTPTMMRDMLESEGIEFISDAVDLKKYFWEPEGSQ